MSDEVIKRFRGQYGVDIPAEDLELPCYEFAERYAAPMRLWGGGKPRYIAVTVREVDYLWRLSDGRYDGWDRAMS
jgi:hypothetical protein